MKNHFIAFSDFPNIKMDVELKNRILGEARFLRALHYFNLVRYWGEMPLRIEPVSPIKPSQPTNSSQKSV